MPQLSELRPYSQGHSERSMPIGNQQDDWVADSRFTASRAELVEQKLAALQSRANGLLDRRSHDAS